MDPSTDKNQLRRERNRVAVNKYRQTEAGKAAMARYVQKRRESKRQKDSLTNPTEVKQSASKE